MRLKLDSEMQWVGPEGAVMDTGGVPWTSGADQQLKRAQAPEAEVPVGERIDFTEAFRTLGPRVRRILRRLGVPHRMLDDAVQDVFLTGFWKRGEFRGDSSVATWITGIAIRKASNYRRRCARAIDEAAVANSELVAQQTSDRADPYQLAVWQEADAQLQELLETLDELERTMFVLRTYEDMRINEAAEVLGIPQRKAYRAHETARIKLRKALTRKQRQDEWRIR